MSFDPDTFMSQTVDQPMATDFRLIPTGEYQARIDDFDSTAFRTVDFTYRQGDRAGQPGQMTIFECPFVLLDDALRAEFGRDKLTVQANIILDFDASGQLDFGPDRNVQLGRLRAAVGQNAPGPWSFAQLRGAGPLMIRVEHEEDRRDKSRKYARATRFAPIR